MSRKIPLLRWQVSHRYGNLERASWGNGSTERQIDWADDNGMGNATETLDRYTGRFDGDDPNRDDRSISMPEAAETILK
jgi:hypothetical protein